MRLILGLGVILGVVGGILILLTLAPYAFVIIMAALGA